jgi:hypothetical protein
VTLSNHVIVDISVAKSVGDPARNPTAIACLRFVRELERKDGQTGTLMTPAVQAEWKKHASALMTSWLVSMDGRGRVRREDDRPVRDLRSAVSAVAEDGIRAALEKDIHMSEAAILHGVPVASRDNKQRRYLRELASEYPQAGRIQWVNPEEDDPDDWSTWVRSGCVERDVYLTAGS